MSTVLKDDHSFDDPIQAEKIKDLYTAVDELGNKFGKHTLHLAVLILLNNWAKVVVEILLSANKPGLKTKHTAVIWGCR